MPDFAVSRALAVYHLRPLTPQGQNWITKHLPPGFDGYIDPQFLDPILDGITAEGLTIQ